jgi:hypothetical protein
MSEMGPKMPQNRKTHEFGASEPKMFSLIKCAIFNLSLSILEGYQYGISVIEFRTPNHKIAKVGGINELSIN